MTYEEILAFARELRKKQTPAEKFFWQKVRNRRLFGKKFTRQFIIQHDNNRGNKRFFIADFHCHEKNLVVELDGKIHDYQKEYDELREDTLRLMGFTVVRFKNEEILHDWDSVEDRLKELLL
jgi:very-short-patch-repair endonuclease